MVPEKDMPVTSMSFTYCQSKILTSLRLNWESSLSWKTHQHHTNNNYMCIYICFSRLIFKIFSIICAKLSEILDQNYDVKSYLTFSNLNRYERRHLRSRQLWWCQLSCCHFINPKKAESSNWTPTVVFQKSHILKKR